MIKKRILQIVGWTILGLVLLFMYLPLLLIMVYSFSTARVVGGSGEFTFALYAKLFQNEALMDATLNTFVIGISSAVIATLIGTVTAVGLHYLKRGKKVMNSLTQVTVVNAEIVTAVGFFLLFIFLRNTLHLPVKMGMLWLIITHSVITIPYVILAVSPRLNQLNPNLFEAGMDLGAGPMRTLITVIFPQLIKSMISGFAIAFTLSLDDFVVTNMNKGSSGINTISTFVYEGLKRKLPAEVRALSTIIFIVVLLILIGVNIWGKKKSKKNVL